MRLVRKHGRPLLLLPCQRRAAAACLGLYPAQTLRARIARTLLRCSIGAGLYAAAEKVSLRLAAESPFIEFLSSVAGGSPGSPASPGAARRQPAGKLPLFGILMGNPATPGQRFLVLVFDATQKPVAVVKAGFTERARELIQYEHSFLSSVSGKLPGIPRVRATLQSPEASAFALDFFAGESPRADDTRSLSSLLGSWTDRNQKLALAEAPDWLRLEQAAGNDQAFSTIAQQVRGRTVQATISHGDLAPWNIKVSPRGDWMVLDWERGQLIGIPGWDWFHYVLQPAILVQRLPTPKLAERLAALLKSDSFKQYAQTTGISGLEQPLALAYLQHCIHVIKPSEGLPATRNLLDALRACWA